MPLQAPPPLLRDEQGRVQKKIPANLSRLPDTGINLRKAHFAGRALVDPFDAFDIIGSGAHGPLLTVL